MSRNRGILLFTLAAICLATHAQAAIIPVIEDFDDVTSPGFSATQGSNATWSNTAGARRLVFQNPTAGNASTSSSLVQVTTDIAALGGFVFETDIRVSNYFSGGAAGTDIGIVAFSNAATDVRYLFDFNPSKNTVRLAGFDVDPIPLGFSFNVNETYHLSMVGSYTGGGALNVTATFVDPSEMAPIIYNVSDATPLSGVSNQGWGYRARVGSSNSNVTIQFDNFSLVPEPSSAVIAMGCVGLAALGVRRRRNVASSTRD